MTQKAPRYQFDREKFAAVTCESFLNWRNGKQASANISNYDRIALLRRHFFADIDALEKTGEIRRALALAVSAGNRGMLSSRPRPPLLKGRY
jgi:hypothetical protein